MTLILYEYVCVSTLARVRDIIAHHINVFYSVH